MCGVHGVWESPVLCLWHGDVHHGCICHSRPLLGMEIRKRKLFFVGEEKKEKKSCTPCRERPPVTLSLENKSEVKLLKWHYVLVLLVNCGRKSANACECVRMFKRYAWCIAACCDLTIKLSFILNPDRAIWCYGHDGFLSLSARFRTRRDTMFLIIFEKIYFFFAFLV